MEIFKMNPIKTIQGSRIEQARKLSGLTQKQLAEKICVHQTAITQYERGLTIPSSETIKAIAHATGFLPGFFELSPFEEFPKGSLSYRSARSVTAKEEDKAYYNAKLLYEHVQTMAKSFVLPRVQVPVIKEKPEKAAEITRSAFGLSPDLPIKNLTNILERNGVIILSLPLFLKKIDAFSTWVEMQGERPFIAESFGKPGDRIRFSIAHELGHLVMHHPPSTNIKLMEKEANNFASAFLLPKCVMDGDIIKPVTLYSLAQLKIKWGVSMQALIYRAKELKIITERQATYLFTQMASRGWRTQEPNNLDVKIETPQLFRKMIEGLYDSPDKYAVEMCIGDRRASEMSLFA
jgi:Zn-dependent peptidase ImmA (M78 family)/transcriptional regulator with XRE-family HTH domain